MNAEIIAVGSELLTPQRVDTNSLYITDKLNMLGVEVVSKAIVGDDRARLTDTIKTAVGRSQIVILTGGLGPTEDDVTRDAVAAALGRELEFHPEIVEWIAARFARMGRGMAENNKRQAYVIAGAEVLDNPNGTAPGLFVREGEVAVLLLPGPPREMKPMFESFCLPRIEQLLPPIVLRTRFYRVAGMGESDLDQLIAPVYTKYLNPVTTILAKPGDIEIHLRARCETEAEALKLLAEVGEPIEKLLGDKIYSRNGDTLEAVVGGMLKERELTVAVAESCTGGMLAERLTSVAGSSAYMLGGFVTYTDELKMSLLGVDEAILENSGAVSDFAAAAMAVGALEKTKADVSVSITGFAGPDGGTEKDPVGTVYIGLAGLGEARAKKFKFTGDRGRIRGLAVQTALDLLRRKLAQA